jgi:cyclopropane fatty-acyl-phospholipid synthase-like methyltransferase
MILFTNRDIADYYNQTQPHYRLWWQLEKALAVHYGIWYPETRSFVEALQNTNKAMLQLAGNAESPRVLDSGCGVGGSSFFLAKEVDAKVTGITLSEKQLAFALEQLANSPLSKLVDFKLEDYSQTSFPDQTFDVIWAIESVTSAQDKAKFAHEANRILKSGGVLVMADYFRVPEKADKYNWLDKWRLTWSLAPIITLEEFKYILENEGLKFNQSQDFTREITPTSRRMFFASLAATIPSVLYNAFHNTSKFAKKHYKSGFYQYGALTQGLWQYQLLRFVKD